MNNIMYECLKQEYTNNYDIKNTKNTLLNIFNKYTNNHLIYNFISSFFILTIILLIYYETITKKFQILLKQFN